MLYPEGSKVIVKPDAYEEITKGGIIIPETVKSERQIAVTRGTIVAIGPNADVTFGSADGIEKREARVGDKVIFARYGGAEVSEKKEDGSREKLRLLTDEDIVALIE
jgi:chaperonin GroES